MPQFYFADGTQQKGPLPPEELRSAGVTSETLVWHEGMTDWAPAAKVPELASLFAAPATPFGQPTGRDAEGDQRPDERGWTPTPGAGQPSTDALPTPGSTIPPGYRQIGQGFGGGPAVGQPAGHAPPVNYASAAGYGPAGAGASFAPGGQPIPGHGLAVASMVLGILSLVTGLFAFCLWWASVPMAVVTIVLGHVGQRQYRAAVGRRNGMATAGLVCGYIAVLLNAIVVITFFAILSNAQQRLQSQPYQYQPVQPASQPSGW